MNLKNTKRRISGIYTGFAVKSVIFYYEQQTAKYLPFNISDKKLGMNTNLDCGYLWVFEINQEFNAT